MAFHKGEKEMKDGNRQSTMKKRSTNPRVPRCKQCGLRMRSTRPSGELTPDAIERHNQGMQHKRKTGTGPR
jgi:hypothetical protein